MNDGPAVDGPKCLGACGTDAVLELAAEVGVAGATPPGEEPRAGGTLAYHVLDVMESVLESARTGAAVAIQSTAQRPEAVSLTVLSNEMEDLQVQEISP